MRSVYGVTFAANCLTFAANSRRLLDRVIWLWNDLAAVPNE